MPRKFRHLSRDERSQIFALRKVGKSNREIGRIIGRSHTTVGRELSRNSDERGYRPASAHRYSEDRRHAASSVPWKLTPELWRFISKEITKHSPDQVSGRLLRDGGTSVSASWIYFCIHCDRLWGGELYLHLPHGGKKRRRLKNRYSGRCRIPNRVDISERPAIVDEKSRIGDWEGDTILGKGSKWALVSLVDRRTKFVVLRLVRNLTAAEVSSAIIRGLRDYRDRVVTITLDNGSEFSHHARVSRSLGAAVYFARPYHPWERGLNEHTNGLVRKFFPKGTDFGQVSAAQVRAVERLLNNRPRRALGYRTPREEFHAL